MHFVFVFQSIMFSPMETCTTSFQSLVIIGKSVSKQNVLEHQLLIKTSSTSQLLLLRITLMQENLLFTSTSNILISRFKHLWKTTWGIWFKDLSLKTKRSTSESSNTLVKVAQLEWESFLTKSKNTASRLPHTNFKMLLAMRLVLAGKQTTHPSPISNFLRVLYLSMVSKQESVLFL